MRPPRVIVDPLPAELRVGSSIARLPDIDVSLPATRADVVTELRSGADVLVTYRWDPDFLVAGLRWIQSTSAGVDQYPLPTLQRHQIVLTAAPGVHAGAVADHAFALLLAMTRGIAEAVRAAGAREWRPAVGVELAELTLGIVGLGPIGTEIARRAGAWNVRTVAAARTPRAIPHVERVYALDQLSEACREADALMVALPAARETIGIIGTDELAALGAGWLVNVGRGATVDERALIDALGSGRLRGAALDVFETEPLPPTSALWAMPRVIISPHVAGLSPSFGPRLAALFADNLRAYRGDGAWRGRIGHTRSVHEPAAVDVDRGTGHIARSITGQEGDD